MSRWGELGTAGYLALAVLCAAAVLAVVWCYRRHEPLEEEWESDPDSQPLP